MTDKAEDGQCWLIICYGDTPIPKKVKALLEGGTKTSDKSHKDFDLSDIRIMEKNVKARQLISNALSMEDSSKVSTFPIAKEM